MVTIKDCLQWGEHQLSMISSSRLDSELILGSVLKCTRTYFYTYPEQTVSVEQHSRFKALIGQRLNGKPVAYILGEKEFWSMNFKVTPDVLIPRADTELLVEQALFCLDNQVSKTIVDLGTGSGAIACALAKSCPKWQVFGTDYFSRSLEVAKDNIQRHHLPNISLIQGSWLDPFLGESFDLIISNPPYIATNDPHLKDSNLLYEPLTALQAKDNGLADLKMITTKAPVYLKQGGYLMLEHGSVQGPEVRAMMIANGFKDVESLRDLNGIERMTQGRFFE